MRGKYLDNKIKSKRYSFSFLVLSGLGTNKFMANKILSEELLKREILTEREILLLTHRASNGEKQGEYQDSYKITPEQTKKGLDWLNNQRRTPRGAERKNNPFGAREESALDNFSHFTFDGLYNAGNQYRSWYAPIYSVHGKDGEGFQYVIKGGGIEIIG